MSADELQQWFREHLQLRLGSAMSEYVLGRCRSSNSPDVDITIMGADARTGLPIRTTVPVHTIQSAFPGQFSGDSATA